MSSLREAMPSRAFHLIDIENLAHGRVTAAACEAIARAYAAAVPVGDMDLMVVGISQSSAAHTFSLPRAWRRALGPRGHDGADIALVTAMPDPSRLRSFRELVIASGDHFFAGSARIAQQAGLLVTVVTSGSGGRLSHELYRASNRHLTLRLPSAPGPAQSPSCAAA